MILKKIGKFNLFCEKKDGTVKKFKATPEVIAYATKALKVGDSVKCEFNTTTYIIEKVIKYNQETSKGKYSGYKSGYSAPSDERSVYATVGTMIAGMKLTNVKDVKEAVKELFAQGMELVKTKVEEKSIEKKAEEEDTYTEPKEETLTESEEEIDE
jgi:hypothetical protein